jgi:Ca2+-binding EF-hand superfamily protein
MPQQAVLDANAFRKLDLNGDETITLDEWKRFDTSSAARDNFQSLDENGDGQINVTEFLTQAPKHSKRYQFFGNTDETADRLVSTDSEVFQNPGWQLFSFHF